jgi:hypothetical protein
MRSAGELDLVASNLILISQSIVFTLKCEPCREREENDINGGV